MPPYDDAPGSASQGGRYATAQYKQDFLRFVWTFNFISFQIREIRGLTVDCMSDTNGDGNWRPFKRRVQYLLSLSLLSIVLYKE